MRTDDGDLRLVTTNAVARWVAESYDPHEGALLINAKIRDIAVFAEIGDRLVLKHAHLRAVDAVRIFAGEAGDPPSAILLTHSGKAHETPLGLCARADVVNLLGALRV